MQMLYDENSYADFDQSYNGFYAFSEWLFKQRLSDSMMKDVLFNYSLSPKSYRLLVKDLLDEIIYQKEWALYSYRENEKKYLDGPYSTSDFIRGVVEEGPATSGWGGFDITQDDSNLFRLWHVANEVDIEDVLAFKALIQDFMNQFDAKTVVGLQFTVKEELFDYIKKCIDNRLNEYETEITSKGGLTL